MRLFLMASKVQPDLFGASSLPDGLHYMAEFISEKDEQALMAWIETLDLEAFAFQNYTGLRRVKYFGFRYDFTAGELGEADPIPDVLTPLREKAARFAGLSPHELVHVLINEYRPGAPIGWHRDRPQFEDVIGISLGAPARLRFRRKEGAGWERRAVIVEPRSIYLLRGPARTQWEHSIPPAEALRYSITFRSLTKASRKAVFG